jgi:hypothetical protein
LGGFEGVLQVLDVEVDLEAWVELTVEQNGANRMKRNGYYSVALILLPILLGFAFG